MPILPNERIIMLSIQQRPFPINRTTLIAAGIVLIGFTGTLAVLKSTSSDSRSASVRDTSSEQAAPPGATGTTTSSSKSTTAKEPGDTSKEASSQPSQPVTTELRSTNGTWSAPDAAPTDTQPSSSTTQPSGGQAVEPNTTEPQPAPAPSSPAPEEESTDDTTADSGLPILDPLQLPLGGWMFTAWFSNLK